MGDPEQQAVADAFAGLRKERGGQRVRLDRVIEHLVGSYLRERCLLLVDRKALQQKGFGADQLLEILEPGKGEGAMPWEDADLVIVFCRAGAVLTTATEAERGATAPLDGEPEVGPPLGADGSGRYVSALDWLGGPISLPGLLEPGSEWEGWTVWIERRGQDDSDTLWVVRKSSSSQGIAPSPSPGLRIERRRSAPNPFCCKALRSTRRRQRSRR